MSKLVKIYEELKKNDYDTLYLFKSGIFYIFLSKDAQIINNLFGLKLTNLTPNIVKCGFPLNSLDKYLKLLKNTCYNVKIIDSEKNIKYSIKDYSINENIKLLLDSINEVNSSTLSIREAYDFIDKIKEEVSQITKLIKQAETQ